MNRSLSDKPDWRRLATRRLRDALQTARRQARRLITNPGGVLDYARYRAALNRHDWNGLRSMLRPLAQRAMRAGDSRMLMELGHAALRVDEHQLGVELFHQARSTARDDEWRGEPLNEGTLVVHLIEKASQGVGAGAELSGYVRAAAARAARTIVIAEPRMAPLFARTLPEVTVLPFGAVLAPHLNGTVRHIGIDELKYVIGFDAGTIRRLHVPLAADPQQTKILRERYLRGRSLPLVGISWWSSHYGKDLPSLAHWRRLIEQVPAQFVCLQYGDMDNDVATLRGSDPDRLVVDDSVDQLTDMDRFASQIAALDLVVTISNSGAHLAGALGRRMILVRDDLFRRNWPYLSRDVPWYPGAVVIGKNDRPWDTAFDEIIATAEDLIAQKPRA